MAPGALAVAAHNGYGMLGARRTVTEAAIGRTCLPSSIAVRRLPRLPPPVLNPCTRGLVVQLPRNVAARNWLSRLQFGAATADQQKPVYEVDIDISNDKDKAATVIEIKGKGGKGFLMTVTGALNALELTVVSASIQTDQKTGVVTDTFRVTDGNDKQLSPDKFDMVKTQLAASLDPLGSRQSQSSSTMPAIYGMVAAAEVARLRPLSEKNGNAGPQLELAAAEMSQAAAELVALERETLELLQDPNVSEDIIRARENQRAEAATLLERHMAAMDAAIKRLRAPKVAEAPAEEERHKGADLRFGAIGGGTASGAAAGDGFEIFLQAFNWDSCKQQWYKKLKEQLQFIAESGITTIWLPPPTDSVSPQGYLPRDLYNLNTPYGSEGDLRELNRSAHELGLKTVADIVINHRCASAQGEGGKWNKFGGRLPWDATVITSDSHDFNGRGARSTGQVYAAAPNIDHTQEKVRQDYIDWLRWLKNSIGFDGWRLDFVIGYAGKYTKEYIDATVPELAFGEYWDTCAYDGSVLQYNQDAHRQRTVNWIDSTGGTAAAFDFTTKGILQEAVGRNERWRLVDPKGKPPGLIGMWPSRAVTFIDNHDTGSSLQHWPFPWDHIEEGYAYILTHPGTPTVFYDHFFAGGLGDKIRELISIRKKYKLNARSKVVVAKAGNDIYAATIDDKVAMKIGPGNWSPNEAKIAGKTWQKASAGKNYCVWTAE
eukprot:CAMPEP_0117654098 /NCGR_PEP_ID=MMETSP0804-20121206/3558_1 /TAXON_ID=1074897 /ORGANISM="Tetraselmis astigmatica, Strain CCMP880" /LENGTH=714 /DNA_ID=CAMNT_0005460347 /DNA_START=1 /DNA_END=2145 /DNA_ORIENTATION=-